MRRRDASWGTATRRHCAVRRSDAGPADRRAVPAGPPRGAARAISGCRPSEGRAEKIEPMDYRYLGSMFRGPPHWGGNRILYTLGAEAGRWRQHPGTAAVAGVRVPRGGSGCGRSRATGGLRRVGAPSSCACALLLLLVRLRARCVWPSQSLPVRQVLLQQPVGCASSGTDGRDGEGSGGGAETGRVAKQRKLIPPPDVTNL